MEFAELLTLPPGGGEITPAPLSFGRAPLTVGIEVFDPGAACESAGRCGGPTCPFPSLPSLPSLLFLPNRNDIVALL